jgi:hypothetical protein
MLNQNRDFVRRWSITICRGRRFSIETANKKRKRSITSECLAVLYSTPINIFLRPVIPLLRYRDYLDAEKFEVMTRDDTRNFVAWIENSMSQLDAFVWSRRLLV